MLGIKLRPLAGEGAVGPLQYAVVAVERVAVPMQLLELHLRLPQRQPVLLGMVADDLLEEDNPLHDGRMLREVVRTGRVQMLEPVPRQSTLLGIFVESQLQQGGLAVGVLVQL